MNLIDDNKKLHVLIHMNQIIDDISQMTTNNALFSPDEDSSFSTLVHHIYMIIFDNDNISSKFTKVLYEFIKHDVNMNVHEIDQSTELGKIQTVISNRITELRMKIINYENAEKRRNSKIY